MKKFRILQILVSSLALIFAVQDAPISRGADGYSHLKLIRVIPRSDEEIAQAHERARGNACEPVPSQEPLEITSFAPVLTERDRSDFERGHQLLPSSRRHAFTVGLEMLGADRARLPKVSAGQITKYIQNHYVSLQARIQKDPITSELFLHHRPLAITASFGKGRLTEDFTEPTLMAVRDFHSLGLFVRSQDSVKPKNLRTLVLVYKSMFTQTPSATGKTTLRPNYEYVFIRGREEKDRSGPRLVTYSFSTSEQRQKLHLMQPWSMPAQPNDCGIQATVVFTEYKTLGLIPSKSATRSVYYDSKTVVAWSDLDAYAKAQGWRGDALDNLDQILDSVIDGKVVSREVSFRDSREK